VLDITEIGDKYRQQENDAFLWQEHALTASAASSDVFAVTFTHKTRILNQLVLVGTRRK
jgi:hypothetical protein